MAHTDQCYGWDIFETGPDTAEMQRCDECERFADDAEARNHVGMMLLKLNEQGLITELMDEAARAGARDS